MKYNSNDDLIIYLDEIDSTNSYAKRLVLQHAVKDKTMIIANHQTSGRGRKGHSFYSPADTGLYMTIIIKYTKEISPLLRVTPMTAVAVCESINQLTGKEITIKWVNDLFLDKKKIAGILTETVTDPATGKIEAILIGIGINCFTNSLPEEIQNTAGFINDDKLDRFQLAKVIYHKITHLIYQLHDLTIMDKYRNYSFLIGKQVTYEINGAVHSGIVKMIDDDGHLILLSEKNETHLLHSGEIS